MMDITFEKISNYKRGVLYQLLQDAYSFEPQWKERFDAQWREFDCFFFDRLDIADQCGFITAIEGTPIGHISWDPSNAPEYVILGHNCIATRCKGNGYGKRQLQEAVRRIGREGARKIVVTTNRTLIARLNYESVGFQLRGIEENTGEAAVFGNYLNYEMILK